MRKSLLFFICLFISLNIYSNIITSEADSIAEKITNNEISNSFIYSIIKRYIVIQKANNDSSNIVLPQITLNYFKQYENYTIRSIRIKIIKPFGANESTEKNLFTVMEYTANKVHSDSKDFVVKNNLFFKEGDKIDPYMFAESERYLRQNNYIFYSGIIIDPVYETKEADILVFVQDLWSIRVAGNYDSANEKGRIEVRDINFLGFGGTLKFNLKKNNNYISKYKPDFQYDYYRLFDKYGVGSIYYQSDQDIIHYGFGANQSFVQPWMSYLGGANFDWWRTKQSVIQNDTLSVSQSINYSEQDIWLGYNSVLEKSDTLVGKYKHMIIAGRMIQRNYHSIPNIHKEYYQDNYFFIGGLTLLKRVFYQDSYIFSFGKTEDIPIGSKIDLIAGTEMGNYDNKAYFGVNSTISIFSNELGYFLNNTRYGSYVNGKKFEKGLFDIEQMYFTNLHYKWNMKFRNFLSLRYSKSLNPLKESDLIDINKQDGLRGFSTGLLTGDKRIVLNYENDMFLPFTFFGFNTAVISFFDIALLAQPHEDLFTRQLNYGFGFGLRLKNEHLIFSTIQLTLGFYPQGDKYGLNWYRFYNQYQPYYQFNRMYYSKPGVFKW